MPDRPRLLLFAALILATPLSAQAPSTTPDITQEDMRRLGKCLLRRASHGPLRDLAAVFNLDLFGRNWSDSVIAVGPDFSSPGETLRRVTAAHPKFRMTPLADRWPEERIFYRSDHYHFARRGVPILFFTSGTHPDYHQPTDSADRVDAEKASRLVRLLYHPTVAVGDDPARPRWSAEHYREIVQQQ